MIITVKSTGHMKPSIKTEWVRRRNAIVSNPAFQRWAARFPLTRRTANRHASDIFALVTGFVYSQVLTAAIDTGLIDLLDAGPITAADAAPRLGLAMTGTERLLKAAAALGLAEAVGEGHYMLGQGGAAVRTNAGIRAMIEHHKLLYKDLADPVALLRRANEGEGGGGGALSGFWPYAESGAGDANSVSGYSKLMAASQPMVAEQIIDAYDFARHRKLIDIGGGEGAFVAAVGKAFPYLERAVFDLPDVAARAQARVPGIATFGGSFLTDSLPTGYDLMSLVRICHDHNDESVLRILCAAKSALLPGGKLLIVEPMAGPRGDARVGDAYFGFYLLAMGSGRARTPHELSVMLKTAGFGKIRRIRTAIPMIAQAVIAS
jgi:demethylspheroidene O-methyltransferase